MVFDSNKLIETMMGQNWGEARQVLRASPNGPRSLSLYWSLLKCSEGKIEEALNGIKPLSFLLESRHGTASAR